jgi:glycine/D-amino acid oxidase-like deaminating enzyme
MIQKNTFSSDSFSESDIDFSDDQIIYQGESYAHLIFCTGLFQTLKQFDFLNIIPNKGHLLELNVPALSQDQIVHYGNFCIPIGNGKFRIGSTYEWEVADNNVEDSLCNQLLDLFSQHCHELPEVRRTYIGHRPTVIDRNPIIGLLPEDKRLGVFNGLGTKGILQGPYMAKLLVQHLLTAAPIPKTFHVTRFLNNQRLNTSQ